MPERYEELRRRLLAAVSRVCPPWLAAQKEDLVQEALMRLMRLEERSEEPMEFSGGYLHRVAHSLLVDEIRRRKRRREEALEIDTRGPIATLEDGSPDPERGSHSRELGRALRECLRRLIPPRRRAMTLSLLGHPNREIASLLSWDPKRAENLVTRGRVDLRDCLKEKGFHP